MSDGHHARAWPSWLNRADGTGTRRPPRRRHPGAMARVGLAVAALLATLKLYPDAGHAFLFQDETAFAVLVGSFLSHAESN